MSIAWVRNVLAAGLARETTIYHRRRQKPAAYAAGFGKLSVLDLLLLVLPVVAFFTLRTRVWPDQPGEIPFPKQAAIVWAASLLLGAYDGYYGPGTGTFLMIIFIRLAKMDTRTAGGGMKVVNLSSNIGSLFTAWQAGYVLWGVGLIAAVFSILAHYIGAGLAIKNGSKIVKPTVIIVLILLAVKVLSELLFPEFWT